MRPQKCDRHSSRNTPFKQALVFSLVLSQVLSLSQVHGANSPGVNLDGRRVLIRAQGASEFEYEQHLLSSGRYISHVESVRESLQSSPVRATLIEWIHRLRTKCLRSLEKEKSKAPLLEMQMKWGREIDNYLSGNDWNRAEREELRQFLDDLPCVAKVGRSTPLAKLFLGSGQTKGFSNKAPTVQDVFSSLDNSDIVLWNGRELSPNEFQGPLQNFGRYQVVSNSNIFSNSITAKEHLDFPQAEPMAKGSCSVPWFSPKISGKGWVVFFTSQCLWHEDRGYWVRANGTGKKDESEIKPGERLVAPLDLPPIPAQSETGGSSKGVWIALGVAALGVLAYNLISQNRNSNRSGGGGGTNPPNEIVERR